MQKSRKLKSHTWILLRYIILLYMWNSISYECCTFLYSSITDKRSVEDDELPEVDQNTKKSLRSRVAAGKSKW